MPATALHGHVHAYHSQPRTEHLQNTELNMYMYMHTGDMYMYIRVRVHEERLVSIFRELRKTGSHPAQFMYMLGKKCIRTIHGLRCRAIHGLSAQSTNCAIHSVQSADLRVIHELAYAHHSSAQLPLPP